MQFFRLDQSGPNQSQHAHGLRTRPAHHINLVSLEKMLAPVRQHDEHENLQAALVPTGIQLLGKTGIVPRRSMNVGNRWI